MNVDERFMRAALSAAKKSAELGEVPVGAVVVRGDEVVAVGFNTRESAKSSTAHAEIMAIERACRELGGWRLSGCDLYVTLEPCPMCAGAIINSRIDRVVFGAKDPKAGSCGSLINLFELGYNHRPELVGGVLETECADVLKEFFNKLR